MRHNISYIVNIAFVALVAMVMAMAPQRVCAQYKFNAKIDSLINIAENAPDSLAPKLNNDVCWKLRNINPEIAIQYGMHALELAQNFGDSMQLVKSYAYLGVCQRNLDNFVDALRYYELGIKYAIEYDVKDQLGYGYVNLGNLLIYQEQFEKADEYLQKALKVAEQLNDSAILGYVYLNLGRVELGMRNFDLSEEYFMRSIKIRTECKKLNKQISVPKKYLADCHATAGLTQLALKEYRETLANVDAFGDYDLLGELTFHIAKIHYAEKRYDSALSYASRSLTYARNIGSKSAIWEAYSIISNVYRMRNDYKNLSDCYIKQMDCYDSLFKKQVDLQNFNIQYSADSYERHRQIVALNKEKETMRRVNIMALVIFLIVAGVLLFVVTNIRKVKKLNKLIETQNKSLEEANFEITSSINYAQRIQKSTLSTVEGIANTFPDNMIYYVPKEIVSGDWYRVENVKGLIVVAEADSKSVGVPGSLLSMMSMSLFKDTINVIAKSGSPLKASSILDKMRQQVKKMFSNSDYNDFKVDGSMDASVVVIDKETRRMSFAAACQTALIVRGGDVIQLKGDSMRVGNDIKETNFAEQEVLLKSGDAIFLLNNGIRDLQNQDGKRFLGGRLVDFLASCGDKPMAEICSLLNDEIHAWGQSSYFEDMAMLGFRIE
ncbi:MAG: tetratricopeptide repeat protein [Bacteroidales bacterium]|nr:tetratricopeptide repeat protein [Bacteroidales bacterium]